MSETVATLLPPSVVTLKDTLQVNKSSARRWKVCQLEKVASESGNTSGTAKIGDELPQTAAGLEPHPCMRLRRQGNNEDMRATVSGETAMSATLTKQGALHIGEPI